MPLTEGARRALTVRLEVVRDYLPRALHEADSDIEIVHQLRVGTRRARAALDIFTPCLPQEMYKKLRRSLRTIRRAAGEARDWDVLLADLLDWGRQQRTRRRPGVNVLIGCAVARREAAQAHIQELGDDYPAIFAALLTETLAAIRQPDDANASTLSDLATPLLSELLDELDQAASGNLEDYNQLHEVRIIGKRLRYAMEVFAGCFAPRFREEFYPAVEAMQEILGTANDSHVAAGRLKTLRQRLQTLPATEWKRFKPGIDGFLQYHEDRVVRERKRFQAWWDDWQRSGGEAAFAMMLADRKQTAADRTDIANRM